MFSFQLYLLNTIIREKSDAFGVVNVKKKKLYIFALVCLKCRIGVGSIYQRTTPLLL